MSSIIYPPEKPFGNFFRRKPLPKPPVVSQSQSAPISPKQKISPKSLLTPFQKIKSMLAPKKPLPSPPLINTQEIKKTDEIEVPQTTITTNTLVVIEKPIVRFGTGPECLRCGRFFKTTNLLTKHLNKRKTPCDKWCEQCHTSFESVKTFKEHPCVQRDDTLTHTQIDIVKFRIEEETKREAIIQAEETKRNTIIQAEETKRNTITQIEETKRKAIELKMEKLKIKFMSN
jgi:hypothetical protein